MNQRIPYDLEACFSIVCPHGLRRHIYMNSYTPGGTERHVLKRWMKKSHSTNNPLHFLLLLLRFGMGLCVYVCVWLTSLFHYFHLFQVVRRLFTTHTVWPSKRKRSNKCVRCVCVCVVAQIKYWRTATDTEEALPCNEHSSENGDKSIPFVENDRTNETYKMNFFLCCCWIDFGIRTTL